MKKKENVTLADTDSADNNDDDHSRSFKHLFQSSHDQGIAGWRVASILLDAVFKSNSQADLYYNQKTAGPSAFLHQRDDMAINHIKSQNKTQQNETAIDIIKSQKQVPESSIEKIGVMESIKKLATLMVNTMTISISSVDH